MKGSKVGKWLPLKQGLKQETEEAIGVALEVGKWLPLKQGLKQAW